jgi:hypothetical protein
MDFAFVFVFGHVIFHSDLTDNIVQLHVQSIRLSVPTCAAQLLCQFSIRLQRSQLLGRQHVKDVIDGTTNLWEPKPISNLRILRIELIAWCFSPNNESAVTLSRTISMISPTASVAGPALSYSLLPELLLYRRYTLCTRFRGSSWSYLEVDMAAADATETELLELDGARKMAVIIECVLLLL